MAGASTTPDHRARADGDVAWRAHIRSPFAKAGWRQRHGPIVVLCDRFRLGCVAPGCADWSVGLERHQEGEAGLENWVVSHGNEFGRCCVVRGEPGLTLVNIS